MSPLHTVGAQRKRNVTEMHPCPNALCLLKPEALGPASLLAAPPPFPGTPWGAASLGPSQARPGDSALLLFQPSGEVRPDPFRGQSILR